MEKKISKRDLRDGAHRLICQTPLRRRLTKYRIIRIIKPIVFSRVLMNM